MFGTVFQGVINRVNDYVEEEEDYLEEAADQVQPLVGNDKKRVSFLDVVDKATEKHNFPQRFQKREELEKAQVKEEELQREREELIVKTLIKSIYQEETSKPGS